MNGLLGEGGPAGPVDGTRMRGHNLALVLRDLHRGGPAARTELAERTGLARGSITTIVPELMDAGLVRTVERPAAVGPGRPPSPLELDGSHVAALVVQVLSTAVETAAVDLAGRDLGSTATSGDRPLGAPAEAAHVIAGLVRAEIERLSAQDVTVVRVVVVIAAPVLEDPQLVMLWIDLGWGTVDLVSMLREALPDHPVPIDLVNDGNMGALAEYRALLADGRDGRSGVYLKSDSGVGGGVVVGGDLLGGAHGVGFEPGHVVVRPGGRPCSCGRAGCLAVEAGAERSLELAGLTALAAERGPHAALSELVRRAPDDARAGDALLAIGRLVQQAVLDLGRLFDPDLIVLGGHWADAVDRLGLDTGAGAGVPASLAAARRRRGGEAFVVPGALGGRAALEGGRAWGVEAMLRDPLALPRPLRHRAV